MTREEAIRLIILDHLKLTGMSISEFARKCEISKAYISKIINKQRGKNISLTTSMLIAKGMNLTEIEFKELIEKYQNDNNQEETDLILKNNIIIADIIDNLKKFNEEELELINNIVQNSNRERLEVVSNLLKSMK